MRIIRNWLSGLLIWRRLDNPAVMLLRAFGKLWDSSKIRNTLDSNEGIISAFVGNPQDHCQRKRRRLEEDEKNTVDSIDGIITASRPFWEQVRRSGSVGAYGPGAHFEQPGQVFNNAKTTVSRQSASVA